MQSLRWCSTSPAADAPGYQHVFLFYFENEDYSQVIGNTKQAPYPNSLESRHHPELRLGGPDDCADREGCGIVAGDEFLKPELTAIMNSPAWTTQRRSPSAAIR